MRALEPEHAGYAERDGVKIGFETFGAGEPPVLMIPASPITHSREWKAQVPYLARRTKVVTYDGRGNGRSDRPTEPTAHTSRQNVADALAVMDATGLERAVLVTHCHSASWGFALAAECPQRVLGVASIAPGIPFVTPSHDHWVDGAARFDARRRHPSGWELYNRHHWQSGGYREWVTFFFEQQLPEPHSTKQIEDAVEWAMETSVDVMLAEEDADSFVPGSAAEAEALCRDVRCPVLVIHGDQDRCQPVARGERVAALTGGRLAVLAGAGHQPHGRHPVRVNLMLREFVESTVPTPQPKRVWSRARARRRRALYISSPIGLGHALRDVAIADELRRLHPDLEIDWLAQHPVTEVLRTRGERIHPASSELVNESSHIESESGEHDLHVFQAIRRMDEILLANFMLFTDIVRDDPYDLWIGDEAWELDYYLHENPELKTSAYAWLTDFVGWLPMPDGGEREAFLTADYNAEMIEHIARFPRIRDRAIFVGNPDDVVPDRFGPGLPRIRDWVEANYAFAGYVTGFDAAAFADREALRAELGYAPDERVCVVTVGGSGVGQDLLRRVIAAYPAAARRVPGLRMVVVAGPRIDPATLPAADGLEIHAFVPQLYRHLAACDLAVVQGGLTTCMELTATRRPFIYIPLGHHFEQTFHVAHRLDRYGAGRRLAFAEADPDHLAELIATDIGRKVSYRPVEADGAARAAALIAEML